jgi:hypothetical protein
MQTTITPMIFAPKRRWFRFAFSLRTRFVLVTCCAVSIPLAQEAWQWHLAQRRRANPNGQNRQLGLAIMNYQQSLQWVGTKPQPIPPECQ